MGIKTLRLDAIYPGKDSAVPAIDYLSDEWSQSLKSAATICASFGVQLDLWGNGWPFGGDWLQTTGMGRRADRSNSC